MVAFNRCVNARIHRHVVAALVLSILSLFSITRSYSSDPAPHVWFVDSKTLNGIETAANQVTVTVPLDNPAKALAVDPQDRSVWVLHNADLLKFSETGALRLDIDLRSIATTLDHPMALALNPYDRSVWVASQNTILHVSGDGRSLLQWQAPDNVQAVGLDIDESAWVLTKKQLTRLSISGVMLATTDLSAYVINPGYLAIDNLVGYVWVAAYGTLVRIDIHDPGQPQVITLPPSPASVTPKIDALAADPILGTLWVASRNMLYLYNRAGVLIRSVDLTSRNLGTLQAITYDPNSLSMWLGGNDGLARFSGSGDFVAQWPVSNAANAIGAVPFKLLPTLSLKNPSDNALLADPQPSIRVVLGSVCNSVPCLLPQTYLSSLSLNIGLNGREVGHLFTISGTDATYTPGVRLPEGMNLLIGNARDLFGHQSDTRTAHFTIDTIPPRFSNVNPANGNSLTTATVTIHGTLDDPTASVLLLDDSGQVLSMAMGASFSFEAALDPGPNAFTLIARDPAGNEATHALILNYSSGPSVTVTSVADGATIDADEIFLQGIFGGPANTGITVNGVVAVTKEGKFYVNNLPLQPGSNTLTVTATTPDGQTLSQTLTVVSAGPSPFHVTVEPQSGVAPLSVVLSVDARAANAVSQIAVDFDGNGTTDFTSMDPATPITFTYDNPGVYEPRVIVTDSQGAANDQSLAVVVNDASHMDMLFEALWKGMNSALQSGDATGATRYLNESAKRKYKPQFDALLPYMPQIIASYSPLRRVSISQDIGEYAINRTYQGRNQVYLIYFLRDADGVWRLDAM